MHYSVVLVTVTDPSWLDSYIPAVQALVEKHGGQYLARAQEIKRVEGQGANPSAVVVIQWPTEGCGQRLLPGPSPTHRISRRGSLARKAISLTYPAWGEGDGFRASGLRVIANRPTPRSRLAICAVSTNPRATLLLRRQTVFAKSAAEHAHVKPSWLHLRTFQHFMNRAGERYMPASPLYPVGIRAVCVR